MKKSLLVLLMSFSSLLFAEAAKAAAEAPKKFYVTDKNGVRVFDSPALTGKKIGTLVYAAEIEAEAIGAVCSVGGVCVNWIKVDASKLSMHSNDNCGWILSSNLSDSIASDFIMKYPGSDAGNLVFQYKNENSYLNIKSIEKNKGNKFLLQAVNENNVLYEKEIIRYCTNKEKSKLYFCSSENFNAYYVYYEMNLSTFEVTEILKTRMCAMCGIQISEDEKYLSYIDIGKKRPGADYDISAGVIYDLEKKEKVLIKDDALFYMVKDCFFNIRDCLLYDIYTDLNAEPEMVSFHVPGSEYDDEYGGFPYCEEITNNSFPYFIIYISRLGYYKAEALSHNIEPIKDCEFADFMEVNDKTYCVLKIDNEIKLYDEDYNLVQAFLIPPVPDYMEIEGIRSFNGKFYLNLRIFEH